MGFGTVNMLALSHRGNGDGRWRSCSLLILSGTWPNLAHPLAEVRGGGAGRQAAGLLDAAPPSATPQNRSTLFNPVKQCFTHVRRNRPQARVQGVPDTK